MGLRCLHVPFVRKVGKEFLGQLPLCKFLVFSCYYRFPSEYFGMLYGIMIISGGVFGFLQFAFFRWSEGYLEAPLHVSF